MNTVVMLTSDELRHRFVRMSLGLDDSLRLVRSYCESPDDGLRATLGRRNDVDTVDTVEWAHLEARSRSEDDFFGPFCRSAPDRSNPVSIPRGAVNDRDVVRAISELAPDLVATFGCSLLDTALIDVFPGRIINVHLGLSPYYRGSGTNFWALVDDRPELVGATFMYLDPGIDTGEVIHQIRARVFPGDTPHQIGNRLIADVAIAYRGVLRLGDALGHVEQITGTDLAIVRRRADVDAAATASLYRRFSDGLVERYLAAQQQRDERYPIVRHPMLTDEVTPR